MKNPGLESQVFFIQISKLTVNQDTNLARSDLVGLPIKDY